MDRKSALRELQALHKRRPLTTAVFSGLLFTLIALYSITYYTGDTFGLWRVIGVSISLDPNAKYADCSRLSNRSSRYCKGDLSSIPPAAKELSKDDFERMRRGGKKSMPFSLN